MKIGGPFGDVRALGRDISPCQQNGLSGGGLRETRNSQIGVHSQEGGVWAFERCGFPEELASIQQGFHGRHSRDRKGIGRWEIFTQANAIKKKE